MRKNKQTKGNNCQRPKILFLYISALLIFCPGNGSASILYTWDDEWPDQAEGSEIRGSCKEMQIQGGSLILGEIALLGIKLFLGNKAILRS